MNSQTVSQTLFGKAKTLHKEEDFLGSMVILQKVLHTAEDTHWPEGVSSSEWMALLGWNMVSLRDFSELNAWEEKLSEMGITSQTVFELIRVWILGIKGQIENALLMIEQFVEPQGTQIHKLYPDFLMLRGHFRSRAGNAEQPIQDCEIAHSFFLAQKREFDAGRAAQVLGVHYHSLSNYQKAKEWYSKAERIFSTLKLQKKKSVITLLLGIIHYKQGEFTQSTKLLQQSLKIGIKGNWVHRQCFANIALGAAYRMASKFDLAHRHLTNGLDQAQSLSMAREEAIAHEFIGDVHRDEGNFAEAQKYYAATLDIILPLAPEGDIVSETHRRIGECHVLNRELFSAKSHLQIALKMARRQGDRFEEAVTQRVLGELFLALEKPNTALKHIIPSCEILEEIGAEYELAIAKSCYAEILLAERHVNTNIPAIVLLNQAWRHASKSQTLFFKIGVKRWMTQIETLAKRISILHDQQEKTDLLQASSKITTDGVGYNPGNVIVFNSSVMRRLLDKCDLYAATNSSLLISGETGTGKELIARRLHDKSGRSGELVSVNVASISPTLFEREFFGHVKGAFSGADKSSIGFAERAHKGTLFLDEIGDLPPDLQAKILRLIQDGVFYAVGDSVQREVDIRFVAATNVDLFEASKNGVFREDLFYRLQMLSVIVPPLSERVEDILPLMEHFLSIAARCQVRVSDYLNPIAISLLGTYTWPGNVREIISVCQQIYIQVSTAGFCTVDLGRGSDRAGVLCGPGFRKMEAMAGQDADSDENSYYRLVNVLESTGGNRQNAAKILNISRSTLYRQMKQFGI